VAVVGNCLACRGNCEPEVARLNEQTLRARQSFAKGGMSYVLLSVVLGLTGLVFTAFGFVGEINPLALAFGVVQLLGATFCLLSGLRLLAKPKLDGSPGPAA
jgi:hypothetical protein